METNNLLHIGCEAVISNLMVHSLSPQGRRLVEQMYTGDPFHINVMLDSDSKNRSAEIANTYLKTVGRRLIFIKKPKQIKRITISPVTFDHYPVRQAVEFVPEHLREGFDYEKDFKERQKFEAKKKKAKAKPAVIFDGINRDNRWRKASDITGEI